MNDAHAGDMTPKLTGKISPDRVRAPAHATSASGPDRKVQTHSRRHQRNRRRLGRTGITGAIGASLLKPTLPHASIVGPALTVRNIMQREHVYEIGP